MFLFCYKRLLIYCLFYRGGVYTVKRVFKNTSGDITYICQFRLGSCEENILANVWGGENTLFAVGLILSVLPEKADLLM